MLCNYLSIDVAYRSYLTQIMCSIYFIITPTGLLAMSKPNRHVDICSPERSKNSSAQNIADEINWELCFICQEENNDPLQNPFGNPSQSASAKTRYDKLADNIEKLSEIQQLPVPMDIEKLKSGVSLGKRLLDHTASYHKKCKKKFDDDKVIRAEKRKADQESNVNDVKSVRKTRRSAEAPVVEVVEKCFFCEEIEKEWKPLHKVTTFQLDARVRSAAKDTNNTALYSKLQNGDLCAQDALYHSECLCKLYRDANNSRIGAVTNDRNRKYHGLAFSKVLAFIDEMLLSSEDVIPVFKLVDLVKYYSECLHELGISDHYIHSTRFKEQIKRHYEDMIEDTNGRDIVLAFKGDIGDIISNATHTDYDNEGMIIAEASRILRRDILQMKDTIFDGTFNLDCQEKSIPESVKCLLKSIMHGNHTSNPHYQQAILTIGQLIRFNTLKRTRSSSKSMYHSQDREPPIAIYLSELIHSETRDLDIVEKHAHLGLCISKERLSQISTRLGNSAIDTFQRDGVVAPLFLEEGLFCTTAIDNIDHNPTSSTSRDSLHGTAASVHQHPVVNDPINKRKPVPMKLDSTKLKKLPDDYTDIIPLRLPERVTPSFSDVIDVPMLEEPSQEDIQADEEWLNDPNQPSWAVFHARREFHLNKFKEDLSALLPIWRDDSKSPATIRHVLNVLKKAVHLLNPGQPIVSTLDQPLYAIAKKLQWYFPKEYGISDFVFVLGSLHVEMAMLSALGDWFQDSGWLSILSTAKVSGTGNQSLLTGKDVSKTKYCHQVTASVLYRLMLHSYDKAVMNDEHEDLHFQSWRKQMEEKYPQFQYWSIGLKMEMSLFLFTRSIRSRNFKLYMHAIDGLLIWMFGLDHYHYARWLLVHLFDMLRLRVTNPYIYREFEENGHFTVARTQNRFSSMGIDQRHEQLNADIKGGGGAIGLTEDDEKFLRWMLCAPEEARMVREFEQFCVLKKVDSDAFRHHEDSASFQTKFSNDVASMEEEFRSHGNPFDSRDHELINLVSNDVTDDVAVKSVKSIEKLGYEQKNSFLSMLETNPSAFSESIKLNRLRVFHKAQTKRRQTASEKETKDHLHLFSQLYVATQVRDGDMEEFFKHETLSHPPSLSKFGEIRSGDKSELIPCLKKLCEESDPLLGMPVVDGVVMEGSVMANQLKPNNNQSFTSYAAETVYPYLKRYERNSHANRIDVVYDTYPETSLKGMTREKRGTGVRRKVTSSSLAPSNWKGFLRVDENKVELFRFLSMEIFKLSDGEIISAYDDNVTSTADEDCSLLSPSDHEEADTRLFLHVNDMARKGLTRVMIRTVDTDVLMLSISLFDDLKLCELWIDFGSGKHRCYLPIHEMMLDPVKRVGLRFFFAFTGCDQVSFFARVSKATAWKIWNVFPDVNKAFAMLSDRPTENDIAKFMPVLERYVVLLYHRTSNLSDVNSCRRELFCSGRAIDNIPPTREALFQHIKRSAYFGGYVWGSSLSPKMDLPPFKLHGWNTDASPYWSDLPEASRGLRELIKCTCTKGCTGNCKCRGAPLPCTELCKCKGSCQWNKEKK